ncbi:MAG: protein kinase [Gemmataceae bacterium]|nr:protein kinase [Gemmataceae bacterium]
MKAQRKFRGNPLTLTRLRVQFGLTIERFCEKAGLDKGTAQAMFHGDPVSLTTLHLAAGVFNVRDHLELLHPDELHALGVDLESVPSGERVLEWEVDRRLTEWKRTLNGLQYQIVRLRHRLLPDHYARGKSYEIRHLTTGERAQIEEHLRRHAEVCRRFPKHPHIAQLVDVTDTDRSGLWWVLDEWADGTSLEKALQPGPLHPADLRRILLGVASGLASLHDAGIVCRNLSPSYILVRKDDGQAMLTDFELAKIAGDPTVAPAGGLPETDYSALEAAGTAPVDARTDVYSWGRIFVHAAAGALPPKGKEAEALAAAKVPSEVRTLVDQAVRKARTKRPSDMKAIISALQEWQP